ncbi:MAG: hypothetical protein PVI90_17880 [Desulfobacteraceae bacterium]|jgi:hypothetical protein
MDPITVILDQTQIKFTPDGKVAVLDAIASLCSDKDTHTLWEGLLTQHPELVELCENYPFSPKRQTLVTDGSGWERIQLALFDHLIDMELP